MFTNRHCQASAAAFSAGSLGACRAFIAAAALLVSSALAQTIWDGGGGDDNWGTAANWNNNTAPVNPSLSILRFAGSTRLTPNVNAPWTVNGLKFDSGASAFTLGGSAITVNTASGIVNASGSLQTVNNAITLGAEQTWQTSSTGNLTVAGAVTGGASRLTTDAASGTTITIGGILGGTGKITTMGAGTTVLSATNTYTGTTTVAGGTLSISSEANLGANPGALNAAQLILAGGTLNTTATLAIDDANRGITIAAAGGTFNVNSGTTVTYTGNTGILAGPGELIKTGTGTLVDGGAGANTHTGNITVNQGTLQFAKTAGGVGGIWNTSAVTVASGATLQFNNASLYTIETVGSIAGAGTIDANGATPINLKVSNTGRDSEFSGVLSNTGVAGGLVLTKLGTGNLTLSGSNSSYSGVTTVSQGTLQLNASAPSGANGSLGNATSAVIVNDASTAANNTALLIGANGVTIGRDITVANSGTGTPTLGGNITSGTGTFSGNIALNKATTLSADGTSAITFGTGVISGSGNITKAGTGTVVLSGTNTFTGNTTVSAGTLRGAGNTQALGTGAATVTLAGGNLELANDTGLNFARNTTVSSTSTVTSDRLNSGAGVTHTLGTLSIGSQTLNVGAGANRTSGTAGITFGATTLTGNSTFDVGSNAQLTLGALNDGGTARTITKADAGTLVFNATPGAAVTTGSNLVVTGGVAQVDTAGALTSTNSYAVTVNSTTASGNAAFNLNNVNQTIASLTFGGTGAGASAVNSVATGTGTLTLGGNVTYDATNNPGGATISGNLALGANRTFRVGDSSNTGAELTVSAIVSGGGFGITKEGDGALTLTGANTLSGAVAVNNGALILSGANGALASASSYALKPGGTLTLDNSFATGGNNTNRLASVGLTANGGTLNFTHDGAASTNYSETIGALTANAGDLKINLSQAGGGQTSAVTVSSITRGAGGTMLFSGTGLGANNRNEFLVSTPAGLLTNGIIRGAMMTTDGGSTYNLVTHSLVGGTTILPYTGYATGTAAATPWAAAINARPAADQTLGAGYSLNSLVLDSGIDLLGPGADQVLTFTGGAGMIVQTGGASIIAKNGSFEHILAFGATEGIFAVLGSGSLTINRGNTNNITGSGGITKTGSGTLVINARSTNSGTTRLNDGTLRAQTETSALGAGTLQLNQGTLELAGAAAVNFNRNTTVNGDVTIKSDKLANGGGVTHTLGTLAIGAQTLTVDKGGFVTSGTAGVTFGATTLSGDATFDVRSGAQLTLGALTSGGLRTITKADAGTLIFNAAAGGAVTAGSSLVVNGGIAQINSATALTSGSSYGVVVNSTTDSGTAAFNLNSISHTIGTLTFGGAGAGANAVNSVATGTGTLTLGGNVTYDATNHPGGATIAGNLGLGANRTFTVGDSSNTAAELSISAVVSGGGFGITKSGTGTLVLSGTNTYTGATAISQGTLQLNANAPSAANGTLGNSATAVTLNDANTGANATGLLIGTSGVTVARAITVANSGTGTTTLGGNFATAGTSSFTGNVTLNKATTFAAEGASNIAFSTGAISGTGNITKTGDGTVTLSGNNSTFTGAIAVTAGTLNAQGSTNALGTGTTGTTVSSGASLALQGGLSFYNGPLSLAGTGVSGVGALTNVGGSNTWNNTGTNAVSLSDHATIGSQTGTLTIGAARPTFTISGHSEPTETSYVTLGSKTLTFSGTGAVVVNDRIQDFSGQTAGTSYLNASAVAYKPETTASGNIIVNMSGAGSVTYAANANTYTGTTTVQAGTLILATKGGTAAPHDGVTDSFHAINGPLTIGSNSGVTTATVQLGNGGVANELIGIGSTVTLFKDGTLNVNNVSQTIDALTFNGGAVTLGTGTLYLNNDVTVNASDGNTATISGAGGRLSMTLNRDGTADTGPDATRTFTTVGHVNNTYDLTIGGIIQNGNLVKAGNGTMMLNNNNTYTGTTSVTGGILNIQTGTDGSDRSGLGEGGGISTKGTSVGSGGTLQLEYGTSNIAITSEHLTLSGDGYNPGAGALGALNNKSGSNTWGAAGNTFINLAADARINSTAGLLTITGNIGSDANYALTVGGAGNTTISGNIATGSGGTTSVTKDGGGTLILSGNNSYQGKTDITAGVVSVQHNNGLGAVSTGANGTFVTDGAELQLSGNITIGGEALELRGAGISGTSGALHNVSGSNTFGGVVTLATPSTIRNSAAATTLTLSGGTTSANHALTINSTGDTTISGNMTNGTGTLTKDGSGRLTFSGTEGTVGQTNLNVGSMTVGAGGSTTLNTAEFSSATSTSLLIASGGTVNAVYGSGNTNFNGVIDAASAGTFTATSSEFATSSGLTFGSSFTANDLTLNIGGFNKGGSDLSKYFRLELSGVTIGVGTLHITGDTILDFNGASSTFLSSNYLTIDAGVNIIVEGWISAANGVWRAINEVNSGTLSGPNDQVGGTPLSQISFTGYSGLQTTWVFGNHDGWFDREIRPTPEPSTYGAIMMGAALAFLGYRRFVRRKAPPAA